MEDEPSLHICLICPFSVTLLCIFVWSWLLICSACISSNRKVTPWLHSLLFVCHDTFCNMTSCDWSLKASISLESCQTLNMDYPLICLCFSFPDLCIFLYLDCHEWSIPIRSVNLEYASCGVTISWVCLLMCNSVLMSAFAFPRDEMSSSPDADYICDFISFSVVSL